jgi:hypothetical protein
MTNVVNMGDLKFLHDMISDFNVSNLGSDTVHMAIALLMEAIAQFVSTVMEDMDAMPNDILRGIELWR